MALDYLLRNSIQPQLDIIQSVAKALINPPTVNIVGQLTSLLNVLGVVSRKRIVKSVESPSVASEVRSAPPIEAIKGVGRKLGLKFRAAGIKTIADLKKIDTKTFQLSGISPSRLEKWQNMV